MAEYIMAAQNGRKIPEEDVIFGISRRANEMIQSAGEENVINATIGALLDDDGELIVLSSVDDVFMLDQTGVRATLKFCTKKVRKFRERGRMDILEKTGRHECCFHTTDHSVHPLPPEYLDYFGFSDGVDEFYRREAAGARELSELLGKDLCSYGQPGESCSHTAVLKLSVQLQRKASILKGISRRH